MTGLCATGIIQNGFKALETTVNNKIDNLERKIDDVPDKVRLSILENFQVNGTVPITQSQIADMFSTFQQNVLNMIQNNNASQQPITPVVDTTFSTFCWGGRFHPVPADFTMPKCNLKLMWDLWWSGNQSKQYAPYRTLKGIDMNNRSNKVNLSKVRKLMQALTSNYVDPVEISSMTVQNRDALFERLFLELFNRLFPDQTNAAFDARRFGDQSYLTIYNYL